MKIECRNWPLLFSIVCMRLFATQAYGEPVVRSVTGTLTHNSSVTVSGSNFGTKTTADPYVWDTFESGTNNVYINTSPATIGQWQVGAGSDRIRYSNAHPHSGDMGAWGTSSLGENMSLAQNLIFSQLYMDFWVYVDYVDTKTRNWKPWRFYGNNDDMQLNSLYQCNYGQQIMITPTISQSSISLWGGDPYSDNSWQHYQLVYKESPVNSSGGLVLEYINGGQSTINYTGVTRYSDVHFNQVRIGHYWALDGISGGCSSNGGVNIYIDNVYIDTTWARVELGNNPVYANSNLREIQIPRSWSDGSITITSNLSSFKAGDVVYLFVSDSDGNLNASGYPVRIGSPSLNTPTNLKMMN